MSSACAATSYCMNRLIVEHREIPVLSVVTLSPTHYAGKYIQHQDEEPLTVKKQWITLWYIPNVLAYIRCIILCLLICTIILSRLMEKI